MATQNQTSRRRFLAQTALAGAAFPILGRCSRAAAIDRVRLASIGVGGQGATDLGIISRHAKVDVVAICDVDSQRLAAAAVKFPMAAKFDDYRKMFDAMSSGIDAVHVATPDHTHAHAAISAMNLGKHVYCQKPLTHDVFEARQMRLVAEKQKVTTQMGTQVHSASVYRTAVQIIQSGAIGKVREVHSWSNKTWGYEGAAPVPAPVPQHLNWDLWLGTSQYREFAEGHYHPENWRRWYDFGCGTMGDMSIHILDPVFSALRLAAPLQIVSTSPTPPAQTFGMKNQVRYRFPATEFTAGELTLTWSDGGLMPDSSNWPKISESSQLPGQGSMFIGEKGSMLLPHSTQPVLLPIEEFKDYKITPAPEGNHYHLWLDACLGGIPTTAHFGYAGPLTEAVLLGVLANRFPQQVLQWKPAEISIPNHAQANALLRREYRKGWSLPGIG